MFKTGKAAMIINGDWSWGEYKDIINFGITRLPMVSETNRWPSPLIGAKGYSININTIDEKLLETIKLLKYLSSLEKIFIFLLVLISSPPIIIGISTIFFFIELKVSKSSFFS